MTTPIALGASKNRGRNKKVNNLNLSRISSSRFNDIEYLTPIKDIFFKSEDNLNNLDDLNVLDDLDNITKDDKDYLDVLNVPDLVEIEDEKFEEVD